MGCGELLQVGHGAGIETHGLHITVHQLPGQDHVTQPQGGSDGLGKSIQVDHFVCDIDAADWRDLVSVIAEFGIIIVLNDVAALPLMHPFQQFQPALDRHGKSQGKVLGRRDVNNISI